MEKSQTKYKILIADDSEMNRMLLAEMLEDEYEIVEAEDGARAVSILQEHSAEFSLVLLDIVMPEMDGFEVLAYMNKYHWIEDIPVIMISAERSPAFIERAYTFGATDYISRPFDFAVVRRRVTNTITLYARQRRLVGIVADQLYEKEKLNHLMVSILSHIVEFRNGESGLHVIHINMLTELLLRYLVKKTDQYRLSNSDITIISIASALHDIGKIAVPDGILNKPGKLTDEEFAVMKHHTVAGAEMLDELPLYKEERLVKYAYQIARWHHERFDGRGYPDGLKGDEIPIAAQVVSIADVYDALTSERCYKKAYSHETAMQMILDGQCGCFNPVLLECLQEMDEVIRREMKADAFESHRKRETKNVSDLMLNHGELSNSERNLQQLEFERSKFRFLASQSEKLTVVYTCSPPMLSLFGGNGHCILPDTLMDPFANDSFHEALGEETIRLLIAKKRQATPEQPRFETDCELRIFGEAGSYHLTCETIWSSGSDPHMMGIIGQVAEK